MTDIKKPTGEELAKMFFGRQGTSVQKDFADCFDAGIQHARVVDMPDGSQAVIPPADGSRVDVYRSTNGSEPRYLGSAQGSVPAPASEELVERLAKVIRDFLQTEPRIGRWTGAARAVLAEIAKTCPAPPESELAGAYRRGLSDAEYDARATISTLEARVKELEGELEEAEDNGSEWAAENLVTILQHGEACGNYDGPHMNAAINLIEANAKRLAELATAREQHRAEVAKLRRAHANERQVANQHLADWHDAKAQLAARDEELRLLRAVESDANAAMEQGQQLSPDPHYRWASLEKLDEYRAKASPPPGEQPKKNPHIGQSLDDFLRETGELDEVNAMVAEMQGERRNCISDEGPPRVGDLVDARFDDSKPFDWLCPHCNYEWWHTGERPQHKCPPRVGDTVLYGGFKYPALDVRNGSVRISNEPGDEWRLAKDMKVIRRAQPSPVASEPKCKTCNDTKRIIPDDYESCVCPDCDKPAIKGGHGPHHGEIAELRRRIKRFEDLVGMASLAFSRFDAEIQRERGGK